MEIYVKLYGLVILAIALSAACTCQATGTENSNPSTAAQSTPESEQQSIPINIEQMSSAQLCERLISIDTIPTFEPTPTDPIYESLIKKDEDAIPCLVDKITDDAPVPDPRYSVPTWRHYAVGDTAIFVLLRILSKSDNADGRNL